VRVPLLLLMIAFALPARAEEMVRIAIRDDATQITLSGHELEVRKLEAGEQYVPAPGGRSEVLLSKGAMMLDGAPVKTADGVKYRSKGLVRVADKQVRGQIEVRPNGRGKLIAINVVPLEDYLAAVLGSEMPAGFPQEALKAQAVAARTYAVQRKIAAWGKPYHLGATVLHQVYGGARAEDPRTLAALKATVGEVLVWKMEPIEAYFHSSCGGQTEAGRDALGRNLPYLRPASCPCSGLAHTSWSRTLEPAELGRALAGARELKVIERTATGRAQKVLVRSPKGSRTMSGVDLRRLVGYDTVRSLSFEVRTRKGKLVLEGKGFGHGAGLCQWGARRLAERGWDYQRILAHYDVGAELRKMY
jgi:stage II sporulation protein D